MSSRLHYIVMPSDGIILSFCHNIGWKCYPFICPSQISQEDGCLHSFTHSLKKYLLKNEQGRKKDTDPKKQSLNSNAPEAGYSKLPVTVSLQEFRRAGSQREGPWRGWKLPLLSAGSWSKEDRVPLDLVPTACALPQSPACAAPCDQFVYN